MKKTVLFLALIVGLLVSATMQAQNMSRYITLTVKNGTAIKLSLKAAAANTPIRIVSGSNTKNITVGTNWYNGNDPSTFTVTAGASTMTVYGDIIGFDCSHNEANLTSLDVSKNTKLIWLNCYYNQLSSLDVSNNTQLKTLNCSNNQLTSLDVSNNKQLNILWCYSNQLTSLDVSNNMQLNILWCYSNQLTSLDVSGNTQLKELFCYSNQLTSLDVSGNTHLEGFDCYNNNLSSLDVSNNTQLMTLNCNRNRLTSLYVSGSTQLEELNCDSNRLTSIDVSHNTWLEVFDCSDNNLSSLDVSNNTQLMILNCDNNRLTSLDVSHNTHLEGFNCFNNNLSNLDVSGCTQLTNLECYSNQLASLDVSHNTQLKNLWCSSNQLTSLDVSNNTKLMKLICYNNRLTFLDVSNNTQLYWLSCHLNQFTSLDVTNNTELMVLCCYGNNFTTAALDDIYCALPDRTGKYSGEIQPVYDSSSSDNATVKVTNAGNATAKNWKVQYSNGNTDIITIGAYKRRINMSRYITLTVKNGAAIKLDFKAAAGGTPVRIVSGTNTQDITVGTSWKGIASYTAGSTTMTVYGDLIWFYCANNGTNITAIDVSNNTQLELLNCSYNNLSSLNVSKNTQLMGVYCYGNNFTTAALDDIYYALPDRTGKDNGVIQPVYDSSSSDNATVKVTNAGNATAKNWKVQYSNGNTDIITVGAYKRRINMSR